MEQEAQPLPQPAPPQRNPVRLTFWGVNIAIFAFLWWSLASVSNLPEVAAFVPFYLMVPWVLVACSPPVGWFLVVCWVLWHGVLLGGLRSAEGSRAFRRQVLADLLLIGLFVGLLEGRIPLRVSLMIWGDELRAYAEELRHHPDAERSRLRVEADLPSHADVGETDTTTMALRIPDGTERVTERRVIGPFHIRDHCFLDGRVVLGIGDSPEDAMGLIYLPPGETRSEETLRPRVSDYPNTFVESLGGDWQMYLAFVAF